MHLNRQLTAIAPPRREETSPARKLAGLQVQIERELIRSLQLPDEQGIDPLWTRARAQVAEYTLRPAKRVRPVLALIGHGLATGFTEVHPDALRCAAALELLHTFLLIHDDVADRAPARRGGPSLQLLLAPGRAGEDLSIVMGDHLFASSLERMLEARSPGTLEAVLYLLKACRFTAAGQLLDLQIALTPLAEVTLFQTLKVAHLKTARYGFVAPLVCGAILGGAGHELREVLERVGRHVGIAFQLRDDLIGLFGEDQTCGKSTASDYFEGKRTFPVIAAYTRADALGRRELERLWALPVKTDADLVQARGLVERRGGREATERAIDRATRTARRALSGLSVRSWAFEVLDHLFTQLEDREV